MSETKVPREMSEIQNEFNQLAFRAGQLQYQIDAQGRDLKLINEQLRDLNFEAAARNNLDAEIAKKSKEESEKANA